MLHVITYCVKSLKVTQNGTVWNLWYGFLFVFHSNYGSILYHFRDRDRYLSKIANFFIPLYSTLPLDGFPSEYCHTVWCGKLEWLATRWWWQNVPSDALFRIHDGSALRAYNDWSIVRHSNSEVTVGSRSETTVRACSGCTVTGFAACRPMTLHTCDSISRATYILYPSLPDFETASTIDTSIVCSKLDYCKSL